MEQFLATEDDAVNYLKSCCKNEDGTTPYTYGGFYCGITNNVTRREDEHEADYLGWVNAKTFARAKSLEARMHKEGFDTGEQLGHGREDSIYVYVYRKTRNTIE